MLCPICQFDTPSDLQNCRACGAALGVVANAKGEVQSDTLPQGTLLLGTYAVENLLGQGGFGITYKCHDLMLDRRVAVKEFFPAGSRRQGDKVCPAPSSSETDFREARAQFLAEARLLARCHHAGIVSVYAAFEANETAYMVMELLHGQSLGQLLEARGGRLNEDDAVSYIERTGEALQFVHDLGLLHRDIKPENIIVCDDGRVMLIDFGTAREFSKGQAQGHTIIVTPGYAPLEQYARQAQRGAFTDVYALAATLYHLLTGHVPPAASDRAMGVLVPPVRQENRPISRSVARAVEMGLQMEVAKRPQSVREFLELMNAPIEENLFEPIALKSQEDQSRPVKSPALGRPVAPYPGSDQARQQLLEMVDSLLPASPQPVQLAPQSAFVGGTTSTPAPNANPSPIQSGVPSIVASPSPSGVPGAVAPAPNMAGGGVLLQDVSEPDGWVNIHWWLLLMVAGVFGLAFIFRKPVSNSEISPGYSVSQSPPNFSTTISRPSNSNTQVGTKPSPVFENPKQSTFKTNQILFSRAVAFSPSGKLLAIPGPLEIDIRQQDGTLVKRLSSRDSGVQGASFSPDDRFLAVWGRDSKPQLWDVQTGKLMTRLGTSEAVENKAEPTQPRRPPSLLSSNDFRAMAFSADSSLFAYAKSDDTSRVVEWWSLKSKPHRLGSLTPKEPITALSFSGAQSLICGTKSGVVQWYQLAIQKLKLQAQAQTGEIVANITLSKQKLVVVGSSHVRSYGLPKKGSDPQQHWQEVAQTDMLMLSNRARTRFPMWANSGWAISSDGQLFAARGSDGAILVWHLPTETLLQSLDKPQGETLFTLNITFSADGTRLTTLGQDFKSRDMTVTAWSRSKTQ